MGTLLNTKRCTMDENLYNAYALGLSISLNLEVRHR